MKKAFLSILIVFVSLIIKAQEKKSLYIDYLTPSSVVQLKSLRNIKNVTSIHFNHPDNVSLFKEHLLKVGQLEDLEKIVISNYSKKKLPDELLENDFIREISILSCPELNLRTTFKQLSQLPILTIVNLGNNHIEVLPKEIKLIENLTELNITLNSDLNLEGTLEVIKTIPTIKKLGLPVNQLSELPDEIGEIKSLRELDLTNNNLTDLPDDIGNLDSLEVLKLQKNIIVYPGGTYEKLKKLNIKYLSIDEGLNEEEMEKLKNMFPDAKIEETKKDALDQLRMEEEMQLLKDSIKKEILQNRLKAKDSIRDSVVVFTKPAELRKVFSLAYLHFAEVFDKIPQEHDFDSLLFDERFYDTNYYNVYRRQKGFPFEFIHIKMVKPVVKNQIWFYFLEDEYLYKNHKELEAFNDMVWVVVDEGANPKSFKENFVKNKSYSDFRLSYQSGKKNFILELKSGRGIEKLTVVPRFQNKEKGVESSQVSYSKRYLKYEELLNKKRFDFNKNLFRERATYKYNMARLNNKIWSGFSKMYFSEEEKNMSKEEWLEYHDQVVANEVEALKYSEGRKNFFVRLLELSDYKHLKDISDVQKEKDTQLGLFAFENNKHEKMPITSVVVINKTLRSFKEYPGSHSVTEFYLFLRSMDDYAVVAFLRNGDVAITDRIDFTNVSYLQNHENLVQLKVLQKELTDNRMIFKNAKL